MIRPTPTSTARASSLSALVVAVEPDPARSEAGAQRHGQLAAGADVEVEPLLRDPAHAGHGHERLAGVVDVGAGERLLERPGTCAEVVLVDDVGRRTELTGELVGRHPGHLQHARAGLGDVRGPQRLDQHVRVCRRHQPGRPAMAGLGVKGARLVGAHHIRSGAVTPSRSRPRAKTTRVASTRRSRARCTSVGSSSPRGRTRQTS